MTEGTNVGAPHGAIRARQGEDDAAAVMTTGGGVELTALVPGSLYRLYTKNTYLRDGQMGEFVKKGKRHCQLHGDYIGPEFQFIKVKESGKRSSRFALAPESIVRAVPVTAPLQGNAESPSSSDLNATGAITRHPESNGHT